VALSRTAYDRPMPSGRPPAGAGQASAAAGRRPRYRTWIRSTRLAVFAVLSGACLAGSALSLLSPWFLLFLVPFALFGYIAMILALTVYRFAPRGGDLQRRIHDLIVAKAELPAASRVLDVGCGSGSLVVKLARASAAAWPTPCRCRSRCGIRRCSGTRCWSSARSPASPARHRSGAPGGGTALSACGLPGRRRGRPRGIRTGPGCPANGNGSWQSWVLAAEVGTVSGSPLRSHGACCQVCRGRPGSRRSTRPFRLRCTGLESDESASRPVHRASWPFRR